jgi:DNA-binding XRE family transcriptional regulator
MHEPLRVTFARLCRESRVDLDITQRELAIAVGVSRPHIAAIESGRANPPIELVTRIGQALGLEIGLTWRPPIILGDHLAQDVVHARCSGYSDRRLRSAGWLTKREVEIVHGRSHGWVDLLAYEPRTRTFLIVEIKTALTDIGALERQIGWYEREARALARRFGWRPLRIMTWVLALASGEVDAAIATHREVLRQAFPVRAVAMRATLAGTRIGIAGERGLALIDPASRRRDWLIPSRSDGRRSPAPYRDHGDARARLAGSAAVSA